jgi:hypothetical protein
MYRLLLLLLVCINSLYAQEVRKKLVSVKILPFTFEHVLKYDVATSDSSDYVHCYFQNIKYTTITDIGSIVFCMTQKGLDNAKSELSTVIKFVTENPGTVFTQGNYNVYDFARKSIYYTDNGGKTTQFNINVAKKLLLAMEGVKLRE